MNQIFNHTQLIVYTQSCIELNSIRYYWKPFVAENPDIVLLRTFYVLNGSSQLGITMQELTLAIYINGGFPFLNIKIVRNCYLALKFWNYKFPN